MHSCLSYVRQIITGSGFFSSNSSMQVEHSAWPYSFIPIPQYIQGCSHSACTQSTTTTNIANATSFQSAPFQFLSSSFFITGVEIILIGFVQFYPAPFNFVALSHSHLLLNDHRDIFKKLRSTNQAYISVYMYTFFFQFIAAHHTPGHFVFPLEVVTSIRRRRRRKYMIFYNVTLWAASFVDSHYL